MKNNALEEDAPWSWWMLSLTAFALMLVSQISARVLVYTLGGSGPKEGLYIGFYAAALLRGFTAVLPIDYTAISVSLNGAYAPWSWLMLSVAYVDLIVVCILVSDKLFMALGGRRPNEDGFIRFTTVVICGVANLAFEIDYTAVGDFLNRDEPRSPWIIPLAFFCFAACVCAHGILFDTLGGIDPNEGITVAYMIVAVVGLVALAFKMGSFFYFMASCALLAMVVLESGLLMMALRLGDPYKDISILVCVITVISMGMITFAPMNLLLDNVLLMGTMLGMSMKLSTGLVEAVRGGDTEAFKRVYCASTIALSGVFWVLFMNESYKAYGAFLLCGMVVVLRSISFWRG